MTLRMPGRWQSKNVRFAVSGTENRITYRLSKQVTSELGWLTHLISGRVDYVHCNASHAYKIT